jgi:hypothetical protein
VSYWRPFDPLLRARDGSAGTRGTRSRLRCSDVPMRKNLRHGSQHMVYAVQYDLLGQKYAPERRLEASFEKSAIRVKESHREVSAE